MEAAVITMTDTDCRITNYNTDFINDQHICAGAQEVDGGALMVSDRGLASWGTGCARDRYPGVFTELSYFTDWVYQISSQNSVPS